MTAKTEKAGKYFDQGFGCAQSVLASFAQDHGLDEKTALRLATGFGSGMGRLCEVCGALTGAFMVIGLQYGRDEADGEKYGPQTEKTYRLVAELASRFRARNGSIYCRDLIGHDLSNPEERARAREQGLFKTICGKCVRDSVELLQEALRS